MYPTKLTYHTYDPEDRRNCFKPGRALTKALRMLFRSFIFAGIFSEG